jgi:hypothetical protein
MRRSVVTLDDIWVQDSTAVRKLLGTEEVGVLANKIRLAQLYRDGNQLIPKDKIIVNHPQFVKLAKEYGRLEDVKAKIALLLTLEPLFNEKNLLAFLDDYNPIRKLYISVGTGIVTRDAETLQVERISKVAYNDTRQPHYHKGMLYATNSYNQVVSIDLTNNEEFVFLETMRCFSIAGIINDILYYVDSYTGLISLNLDTHQRVLLNIGLTASISNNFIYTFERNKINKYDGRRLPLTLISSRPFTIVLDPNRCYFCQVIDNRIYLNDMKVYDLETLRLLNEREISGDVNNIYSYGGKIYVHSTNGVNMTIKIYDSASFEYLGNLVEDLHIIYFKSISINGNKLVIVRGQQGVEGRITIAVYDLDTNTVNNITMSSGRTWTPYAIIG